MFTVYKKIISPESSPVLGPASAPKEALVNAPNNHNHDHDNDNHKHDNNNHDNNHKHDNNNHKHDNHKHDNHNNASMEPFSLCNYCCSPRNNRNTNGKAEQEQMKGPTPMQDPECKYEFGHATHYIYCATTPRLICEFETGTPVAP